MKSIFCEWKEAAAPSPPHPSTPHPRPPPPPPSLPPPQQRDARDEAAHFGDHLPQLLLGRDLADVVRGGEVVLDDAEGGAAQPF